MKNRIIGFKGVLIIVIIVSCVVIVSSAFLYFYTKSLQPISGLSSSQGEVSLTIEAPPPSVSEEAAAPAAGDGAGGGVKKPSVKEEVYDFVVDQALIKVTSKVGETFKKTVSITNPNDVPLRFGISTNLDELVFISEGDFEIPARSEKTFSLTFVATEDVKPDVYAGKIFISTQYGKKEIPIIYEVRTKKALFDVSLNIPAKYKILDQGDDLFFQVTVFNLGEIGKVDVLLEYEIKDFEGRIITAFSETVAVETQASFSKVIKLPKDIKRGDYVILARAKYGLTVATASDLFSVGRVKEIFVQYYIAVGIFVIIILLIVIIYILKRKRLKKVISSQNKKLKQVYEKVSRGRISGGEASAEIERLQFQYALLEDAYNKGYIKKGSYKKSKGKISSLIARIKKRL